MRRKSNPRGTRTEPRYEPKGPIARLCSISPQRFRNLNRLPNRDGKGAALKTGFLKASGDIVVVQDADLEYDPCEYQRLIQPILRDHADVVYGSRFFKRKRDSLSASLHCFLNRALTTLSNLCTNLALTDMETCYKVFRRSAIQDIAPHLKEKRFGIEPEITAKVARAGYRVYEVPIAYERRSYRDGKRLAGGMA